MQRGTRIEKSLSNGVFLKCGLSEAADFADAHLHATNRALLLLHVMMQTLALTVHTRQ